MQGIPEPAENLALDFERPDDPPEPWDLPDPLNIQETPSPDFDIELGSSTEGQVSSPLETVPLERGDDDSLQIEAADHALEEMSLGDIAPKSNPMEILVGSPDGSMYGREETSGSAVLAPVGSRFLAGIMDTAVLAVGALLFSLIFWGAGGHLSPRPVNFAVLGVITLFLIFSYFGLFTALTSTTPGLLLMGFEVRNLRGLHPTPQESCWRAFGVLVSSSALMLGFIWAWVDSEGLTWHDRMSGTFVTLTSAAPETADLGFRT